MRNSFRTRAASTAGVPPASPILRMLAWMRRAVLLLLPLSALAAEDRVSWDLEGYPRLFEAVARARRDGSRLLLGLSGSPT